LIGDGLAHVGFGTIALALALGWPPLVVSIPMAVLASWLILKLSERAKLYGDAAIGVVSAVGIATGVILSSVSKGFNLNILSYLFGSIMTVSVNEVWLAVAISVIVLAVILLFFNDLWAVAFDADLARASGLKADKLNALLAALTAVAIVLAVKIVGVMLVSALLILPATSALQLAKSFRTALILALSFALVAVLFGLVISAIADLPAGATIVLINFLLFVLSLIWRRALN
jgi:zinc transport system permease protein